MPYAAALIKLVRLEAGVGSERLSGAWAIRFRWRRSALSQTTRPLPVVSSVDAETEKLGRRGLGLAAEDLVFEVKAWPQLQTILWTKPSGARTEDSPVFM